MAWCGLVKQKNRSVDPQYIYLVRTSSSRRLRCDGPVCACTSHGVRARAGRHARERSCPVPACPVPRPALSLSLGKQAARTHPSVSDRRSSVVAVKGRARARSHLECEIPRPEPGHVGGSKATVERVTRRTASGIAVPGSWPAGARTQQRHPYDASGP